MFNRGLFVNCPLTKKLISKAKIKIFGSLQKKWIEGDDLE